MQMILEKGDVQEVKVYSFPPLETSKWPIANAMEASARTGNTNPSNAAGAQGMH